MNQPTTNQSTSFVQSLLLFHTQDCFVISWKSHTRKRQVFPGHVTPHHIRRTFQRCSRCFHRQLLQVCPGDGKCPSLGLSASLVLCPLSCPSSAVTSRCCSRGVCSHYSCSALGNSLPRGRETFRQGTYALICPLKIFQRQPLKRNAAAAERWSDATTGSNIQVLEASSTEPGSRDQPGRLDTMVAPLWDTKAQKHMWS